MDEEEKAQWRTLFAVDHPGLFELVVSTEAFARLLSRADDLDLVTNDGQLLHRSGLSIRTQAPEAQQTMRDHEQDEVSPWTRLLFRLRDRARGRLRGYSSIERVQLPVCDGEAVVEIWLGDEDIYLGCRPASGEGYLVELTAREAARIGAMLGCLALADVVERLREVWASFRRPAEIDEEPPIEPTRWL